MYKKYEQYQEQIDADRKFASKVFAPTVKKEIYDPDPDMFYYNVPINHNPSNGLFATTAEYSVTQTQSIINKPGNFYCSIVSFSVPANRIPIFIMPIQPGSTQTNPNLSTLSISFTYNNITYGPEYIIYAPENSISTPPPPSTNTNGNYQQNMSNEYYYVFSYNQLIQMINTTINTLITANAALSTAIGANNPYFTYDSTTQLLSFIAPYSMRNTAVTPINFYFNTPLRLYLDSFRTIAGNNNSPLAYQMVLDVKPNNFNGYATPGNNVTNPPAFLEYIEEYNSLQYWNSFKSLIFTSADLPIEYEQLTQGDGSIVPTTQTSNTGNLNLLPILTQFAPVIVNSGDQRSIIVYYPTGPYRLIDMTGENALIKLSIRVEWMDTNNNRYPLQLSVGTSAFIKILFIKKSVVKNMGGQFGLSK